MASRQGQRSDRWVSVLERLARRTGVTLGPRNPHSRNPTAGSVLCAMSLGAKAGREEGRGARRGGQRATCWVRPVRAGTGWWAPGCASGPAGGLSGALSVCLSCWEGGQEHRHRGPARHLGLMPSPAAALGLWLEAQGSASTRRLSARVRETARGSPRSLRVE